MDLTNPFAILSDKVESWWASLIAMLPNLIVALVAFIGFWMISRAVRTVLSGVLGRLSDARVVNRLLTGLAQYFVLAIGFFVALGILQLDKAVTSLLAGAGVIGLALGFAFQEIASNFIAGVLIAFRKPFRQGDFVKVNEFMGRITDMDLRTTRITTMDGLEVIIPNKDMFTNAVVNYTSTRDRRVDFEVGVSYGEDLRRVKTITLEAVEGVNGRAKDRSPELFFKAFGDSSINFDLRIWIERSDELGYFIARDEAIILVKEAFDRNGITIPFPIRTLDFGIKGGERLRTQLIEVHGRNSVGPTGE